MTKMIKIEDNVILVDAKDQVIGTTDKLKAHLAGKLHRAFSVFIFNNKGQLLLQQRALDKYHSGGLWTNTCCSHPKPGEKTREAAHRRLMEEMGMDCPLTYMFNFTYKAALDNNLTEHEIDHVYFGISDQIPLPNPLEVAGYRYADLECLEKDLNVQPEAFSEWLKICFVRIKKQYLNFSTAHETLVD